MPLTPEKLQALAGALRTSGYKSAHTRTHLAEAKLFHIERGWPWSSLLTGISNPARRRSRGAWDLQRKLQRCQKKFGKLGPFYLTKEAPQEK